MCKVKNKKIAIFRKFRYNNNRMKEELLNERSDW